MFVSISQAAVRLISNKRSSASKTLLHSQTALAVQGSTLPEHKVLIFCAWGKEMTHFLYLYRINVTIIILFIHTFTFCIFYAVSNQSPLPEIDKVPTSELNN